MDGGKFNKAVSFLYIMIKRGTVRKKRGQIQISFGMIFSIILVIAFLGFAFYAIKIFLKTGDEAKAAKFIDELQGDTIRIWGSEVSAEQQEYVVPSYADMVCFINFDSGSNGENSELYSEFNNSIDPANNNFAFYPIRYNGYESAGIRYLDIVKTTEEENPLCIKANNGRVSLILKKDYGENYITIERTG